MKINVTEARADIVRYYENKGYSHNHAETHVPHDPNQVMRIYNLIQEENKTNPLVPDDGADGLLFVQKQVELDRFGQSRLTVRSELLYKIEDTTGDCEDKISFRSSWLRHSLLQDILSSQGEPCATAPPIKPKVKEKLSMTLAQYYDRKVPDYYASMFLDGYTPEQIRYAAKRKMIRQFEARKAAKRAEAEASTIPEVKIVSEVRIK